MAQQGVLIVLSGPSGAGKGTICKELLRRCPRLHYSISATTRPPRPGETDGVNYWFVGAAAFQAMIEGDELLEWAEVYGNRYGTPRRTVADMLAEGKDVVLEIDIQGALQVKRNFPEGIYIYLIPPSIEELSLRIHKRGTDSPEVISKRLSCVRAELAHASQYDYIVLNDVLEEAVGKVMAIVAAEKCRIDRNTALIGSFCRPDGQA